ncbi:MAG: LLM class flavin-dependent oxidoreductase [Actinomycetia bacterium]|nr:LLM class flavin-dependent oxidoreductase [Actinomycetes bacterium]
MTRYSLRLNNDLEPQTYRRIAATAEHGGLHQMWISHDLRWHAAPALVADLAARTEHLRLGIGLHNPYTVHPVELAMIGATLDELTDGRFDLAVGAGAAGFLDLIGIDRTRPLTTMRSALTGIRELLAGTPVTDPRWDRDLRLARSAPSVGLWLGATGPRMRALGGELADGVLALALPPRAHARIESEVRAGQPARSLTTAPEVPVCVWLSVDHDPRAADQALAAKLAVYGAELGPDLLSEAGLVASDFDPMPDELSPAMRSLAVVGDVDEVVERCREILSTGVSHLSFGPPLGPDPVTAVQALVEQVLPQLPG